MTMLSSRSFVRGKAAIDQPDQQRTDRDPGQLVPVEKRKAEQRRFQEIIERHPQEADEGQQQQDPHRRTPAPSRQLQPAFLYGNDLGTELLRPQSNPSLCNAVLNKVIARSTVR